MVERITSAPEYSTTIIVTGSGAEQRIGNWQDARVTFNAALGVRSKQDLQVLVEFFRARKGRLRGFLVKDLLDYEAKGDLFGVGDGTNSVFQLSRVYGDAYNVDIRPIYKPVNGTVQIYSGITLLTSTLDYSINYTTGKVTFTSPPANGALLTWFGEFYVPCRFGEDRLPVEEFFVNLETMEAAGDISVPMLEIRDWE